MIYKRFTYIPFDGFEDNGEYIMPHTVANLLNEFHEENRKYKSQLADLEKENEQLKKALLFFYDVANCECSSEWSKDMEKGCKRFFNCTYEEAEEKYGDYDSMWWEIND